MLRYVRQVFVGSPNHQTFALSPSSLTQQLPVSDAYEQKVRHPCCHQQASRALMTSRSLMPPPSLHSQRLAPRHSASKNRSLRSPVFALLRSSSRLYNLFAAILSLPEIVLPNSNRCSGNPKTGMGYLKHIRSVHIPCYTSHIARCCTFNVANVSENPLLPNVIHSTLPNIVLHA